MPELVATLVSIQVGKPRLMGTPHAADPMQRTWRSAFVKHPVQGRVHLRTTNLDGDRQADLRVHGGPEQAVLAYSAGHYPAWWRELGIEMPHGAFGENFTIDGLDEDIACLGDSYRIGGAVVQVAIHRGPCWKIARRWQIKDLTARVEQTGRSGWYFSVQAEGVVEAGEPVRLLERHHPEWTIRKVAAVFRDRKRDPARVAALAACPALSERSRGELLGLAPPSLAKQTGQ